MTRPLIPEADGYYLPVSLDGDLAIYFRNRDPGNPSAYLDFPADVIGILTIYVDLKVSGADRITVTATPNGHDIVTKVSAAQLNTLKDGTLFGFRLGFPDDDFEDGTYDKPIVVGYIKRVDGRAQ